MSSFVSSSELEEERRQRQEEWEKVRQPEDPQQAPEPEVCNKTLFEQLRDNREAKEAEIAEAKKFRNMIRGIDEDESEFLSQVDEITAERERQKKIEEDEVFKALAQHQRVQLPETSSLPKIPTKIAPTANGTKPSTSRNSQANILSAAIKRKTTTEQPDAESVTKIAKTDVVVKPAVQAQQVIGSIPGLVHYEASSDSDSDSTDSEPGFIPMLQIQEKPNKNKEQNHG